VVIRLAWLQFRMQAAIAAGVLAILAVILAVTGPHLAGLYHAYVGPACHNQPPPPAPPSQPPSACALSTAWFQGQDHILQDTLAAIVLVVPALIGLFWGAPLAARELETGTFRLAWTQSVTRGRWLAARLGVAGLAAVAVGGLLSLMVTWWSSSLDRTYPSRFIQFAGRGIVPAGYAVFGFALGVTAGVLIRRTVPAMAATLAGYAGVRAAVTALRPHLLPPLTVAAKLSGTGLSFALSQAPSRITPGQPPVQAVGQADLDFLGSGQWPHFVSGNWVLASNTFTGAGRPFNSTRVYCNDSLQFGQRLPPAYRHNPQKYAQVHYQACLVQARAYLGQLREVLTYQPAGRYWPLQAVETAIFLALALGLAGFCFWWIRRRIC
jgi:hypothetical protein